MIFSKQFIKDIVALEKANISHKKELFFVRRLFIEILRSFVVEVYSGCFPPGEVSPGKLLVTGTRHDNTSLGNMLNEIKFTIISSGRSCYFKIDTSEDSFILSDEIKCANKTILKEAPFYMYGGINVLPWFSLDSRCPVNVEGIPFEFPSFRAAYGHIKKWY